MQKDETKFANDVRDALESVGGFCFNVHGHRFQKSGMPDMYVAHREWSGWVEFKVLNNSASKLQMMKLKTLLVVGVPAFVVRLKENIVYCELGKETLAYCEEWDRSKGLSRGKSLIKMFNDAGSAAIEIMREKP